MSEGSSGTETLVWRIVWTGMAGVFGVSLLVVLALGAFGAFHLADTIDGVADARTVSSILVDELIEAGAVPGPSSPDEPLLERRVIVMSNALNEHSSKVLVEKLLLLAARDPDRPIDLYISSPGGWGGSAFFVVDAIRRIDAPVNTHAMGLCYSACAVILAASTGERTASADTLIMVHANLDDSTEPFSYDRLDRARYERLWREHAELPVDWFPMTRDVSYFLSAEEALDYGIIDRIAGVPSSRETRAAGTP